MAKTDDTSKARPGRNQTEPAASATPGSPGSTDNPDSPSPSALMRSSLGQAIEAERAQLLQVHAVLKCLYQVLLYADDEDVVIYADVANLAARLVDESVERLDLVRLRPMIETIKGSRDYAQAEENLGSGLRGKDEVRERAPVLYLT